MRIIRSTSLNSKPNSIQLDKEHCEKIGTEVFAYLNQSRGHMYQNVEFGGIYHHTNFEANQFINVRIHANLKSSWHGHNNSNHSLDQINLTQNQHVNVKLPLLHHNTKFNLNQWKGVREYEAKRFYCTLTLWSPNKFKLSESSVKWWESVVPISMVGMKNSLEKFAHVL